MTQVPPILLASADEAVETGDVLRWRLKSAGRAILRWSRRRVGL